MYYIEYNEATGWFKVKPTTGLVFYFSNSIYAAVACSWLNGGAHPAQAGVDLRKFWDEFRPDEAKPVSDKDLDE
jgi:hypothetical protein